MNGQQRSKNDFTFPCRSAGRRMRSRRSTLCRAVAAACAAAPQAQTVAIGTDQTTTVVLPAGGGTAQVNAGVTIQPSDGRGIHTTSTTAWEVTNHGSVFSGTSGINRDGVSLSGAAHVF